jgi:hypothetical protein
LITRLMNPRARSPKRRRRKARLFSSELLLIGFGNGKGRLSAPPSQILPILATALVVALALSAIRIDLIRGRYATAEATLVQQSLYDEIRSLTARMRELRDPVSLTERAGDLGFVRPQRLIHLAPSANPGSEPSPISDVQLAARNAPQRNRP